MIKAKYLSIETKILMDQTLSATIPLLAVLTALSAKAGFCWVTNKRLAQELNCTERSIQQNLAKLKERGIIKIATTASGRRLIILTSMEDRTNITDEEIEYEMAQGCADFSSPTKNFAGGCENFFTQTYKSLDNIPPNRDINISITPQRGFTDSHPSRFVKPTVDEIREYCRERKNQIDAEMFFDFYESKGWRVGNSAMKDWKACVRTWEKKERTRPAKQDSTDKDDWWI